MNRSSSYLRYNPSIFLDDLRKTTTSLKMSYLLANIEHGTTRISSRRANHSATTFVSLTWLTIEQYVITMEYSIW